jgi:arylsulfatase A-like enzyme
MLPRALRRRSLKVFAWTVGLAIVWFAPLAAREEPPAKTEPVRWNVILVLADDLGWAELGCFGNRFNETPHLDRLAEQGMRFTQAYAAAPVCSPFRASLMTGQWPARVGITDYLRPDSPVHLGTNHVTLAEAFQRAGYRTGLIGKWHLSGYARHGAIESPPTEHGFDEVLVSENRGIGGGSYFFPYHFNRELKQRLPEREYLVDRCNLEAVEFLHRNRQRPFFLVLSHYAVHTRLEGKPESVARCAAKSNAGHPPEGKGSHATPQNNPHLAAQLESIDQGIGQLRDALKQLQLDDRTLVIFTSDNGGQDRVTDNGPLRAGKSTLYEGGIRVPLIFHCPGHVQAGQRCSVPISTVDLYPTLLEFAHVEGDPRQTLDGVSLVPQLHAHDAPLKRDALYWHYPIEKPHFLGGRSAGSLRRGRWKLIEFLDTNQVELYDLIADPGESQDLAAMQPRRVSRLRARLEQWRNEVGAKPHVTAGP